MVCVETVCNCLTGDVTFTEVADSDIAYMVKASSLEAVTATHLHTDNNTFLSSGVITTDGNMTWMSGNGSISFMDPYDVIRDGQTLTFNHRTNSKCTVQAIKDGATDITVWKLIVFIGGGIVFLAGAYFCYNSCCSDDDNDKRYNKMTNNVA